MCFTGNLKKCDCNYQRKPLTEHIVLAKDMKSKMRQQVIVRFTSWTHKTLMYKNCKKSKNFRFNIDLTKRRLGLLSHIRQLIKDYQGIDYAFSDVNCRLDLKIHDGGFRAFNLEAELASIISDL